MAKYVDRHSPYASTRAQWGYFKALTGHELPRGISKSAASRLIDQAKKGAWKPPIRHISVRAYCIVTRNVRSSTTWEVNADYLPVHGLTFDNEAAAIAAAQAICREGETVDVGTGVREIWNDA